MGHFFFHVFNGHGHLPDHEGQELADQAAAREIAIDSVRSMVAEDARRGVVDLSGSITVRDETGKDLFTLTYMEAFELHLPSGKDAAGND